MGALNPLANQFFNGWSLVGASLAGFKNKVMQKTPYEGLQRFLGQTYQALLTGSPPPVTHEDMERAIGLVDKLLQEQGQQ
jgi:hypothetical protein